MLVVREVEVFEGSQSRGVGSHGHFAEVAMLSVSMPVELQVYVRCCISVLLNVISFICLENDT